MLQELNRHWEQEYQYPYPKHREIFSTLTRFVKKRQIIALTGLRRVGKTVLLLQLINWLVKNKVERKNILYFSYDREKLSIKALLEEYSKITGVDYAKSKIFVFLDEVQKLENWQEQIKIFYDLYPNIKFVVSGSASLFLKKQAESLAGRIFQFEIPVLSFKEFLDFKNVKQRIEANKEQLKQLLIEYLRKNFIEVLNENQEFYKMYYESIINKVVHEDIPKMFPIENPAKLKALFDIFLNNPGYYLNYDSLASDLSLSRKTVEKYVYYLTESKLIFKAYNFSNNFVTSEKKMKRVYLTAPCFGFLSNNVELSRIVENIVLLFSKEKFFYRDSRKNEIDLVMKLKTGLKPVEVKFKDNIKKKDLKAMALFLKKFNVKEGVIITWDFEGQQQLGDKKIKFIPLWKWLLKS